ncbi:MAG: MFS transporter [Clostridia bacterium]
MAKIKQFFHNLPRWNSPQAGKYLTLKEWLIYCFGGAGAMGAGAFIQFLTMTAGIYVAAAININVDHIVYIGLVTSLMTIITSPLVSYIIDNTNSKFGKFRPYLIGLPLPIIALYFALGQIVAIQNYSAMIIVYTIVFNVLYFLNRVYTLSFNSIVQVISPNMDERVSLMSFGTFVTSLGPTLVTMIYPAVANFIYSNGAISGVNTLGAVKWLVPIIASVFFAIGIGFAFGVKERMVLPKQFKQKQKFMDGMRKTFKNKYFWIVNSSAVVGVFRTVATTFTLWVILYMIFPSLVASGKQSAANLMQTIVVTLIGDACVPGMLFAPWFIRKFGKKNIIIFTSIATTACTIPMLFISNPWALLAMIYLVTLFNGLQIVTGPAVQAEIYDYQQYKTGDRLEGFLSQFGTMITTAIGMAFAFVAPAVYRKFGYIDNVEVLYDTTTLLNIIKVMCGIGVASGILSVIPYFFYDLSEKKHKKIMQILAIRANLKDGLCDDDTANNLEAKVEAGDSNVLAYFDTQQEPNETVPSEDTPSEGKL